MDTFVVRYRLSNGVVESFCVRAKSMADALAATQTSFGGYPIIMAEEATVFRAIDTAKTGEEAAF